MLLVTTLFSTTVALAMTFVAWRATRDERRRSDARVTALAQAIHGDEVTGNASGSTFAPSEIDHQGAFALFASTPAIASGSRWGVALAAGGLVLATLAALAIVFGGEPQRPPAIATREPSRVPQALPAVVPLPLELVALGHERDGDRLTVRGLVRNPVGAPERDRLTAVVSVFDADGALVASARAQVDSPALVAGGQSPFLVTIPAVSDVGRYRVSFQSDGAVVVHVDKRNRS